MIVYCIVRKRTREEYETGWSFGEARQWHTRLETMCVCVCVCVILYSVYNLPILLFVERLKHARPSVCKRGGWGGGGRGYRSVRNWLIRLNGVGRRPKQPVRVRRTKCQRANTCDRT